MGALTVGEVSHFLSRFAPPSLAEEWDRVGLQVGSMKDKVRGILISLDVTEAALDEAMARKANLLITHHPLFFKPLLALDDQSVVARLARWAAQTEINILAFHTNLDSTPHGLNDLLAKNFSIRNPRPLLPARDPRFKKAGLGRIGKIQTTTLRELTAKAARILSLKNLRSVGDPTHPIRNLAVMTGSGGGFFLEAKMAGADALITGDVKYHQALEALDEGIALLDIGHFAGEIGMIELVAKLLRAWPSLKRAKAPVFESHTGEDPFRFWKC